MGRIQIHQPDSITEKDWAYYLDFDPIKLIQNTIDSLRNENRFFVDERFLKLLYHFAFDPGSRYASQLSIYPLDNRVFYRARKYKEIDAKERHDNPNAYGFFQGYDAKNSFVPPVGTVSEGRINPANIRYLYTCSDEKTSILETRIQPGEYVSIAEIKLRDEVHLVDFSKNYSNIDAESEEKTDWINFFVLGLAGVFQKPYVDNGSYYFCQYVSEYLKNWGFDGIAFRSSMAQVDFGPVGVNYTFFNYEKCEVVSSKLYYVIRMEVDTSPTLEGQK